jgi:outer membrane protein assembly factor BamD
MGGALFRVSELNATSRFFRGKSLVKRRAPNLTEAPSFTTLRILMGSIRIRILLLCAVACVFFPERSPAPVVFKPNEKKIHYHAPGEEEISGNADEMFAQAEAAEKDGDRGRAIKIYKKMVKRHPHSNHAAEATFRAGRLTEQEGDLIKAAGIYRGLMESYPQTPHFAEAIESQFRIGEALLAQKKKKVLGVPVSSTMDDAIEIFAAIVRSAPYGRYTARAQFDIGRAREYQGSADLAIEAYQAVVEKFPNDPLAVDAQYQMGYIWFTAARAGTYDPDAAEHARVAFQDFLFRFPKSEKAPQARENIALLENRLTKGSLQIAEFYDKQKHYRAAVLYYNEVIRQQPGSSESQIAKKRIDQLRAQVGDLALQPAANFAEKNTKKKEIAKASNGEAPPEQHAPVPPELRGGGGDLAPLPTDSDSLPPPPAADPLAMPGSPLTSPEPSPTPEATATP